MKQRRKKNKKRIVLFLLIILIIILAITLIKKLNNNDLNEAQEVATQNTITDTEAPILKLNGEEERIVVLGEEYTKDTVTATDNIDGDISSQIKIDGNVDINKLGTYELTYSVTDKAGNTSEVKQKIKVCNPLKESGLPVLMYHFFYDKNKEDGSSKDNNFIEISDFEEQIKYLKDNNFYFPTWDEVEEYIDGKIKLPEKSIVLTFDDGDDSFFELAVPVLQKYDVDGTIFVITSWYGYRANEKQKNVIYESHSDNMHEGGANGKGVMLSWSDEKIKEDLNNSNKTLGGNATVFCYPFGHYNDNAIELLKETGYKLAFTTEAGRVKKGSNKYALPRVRMSKYITLSQFKSMVN